MIVRPKRPKMFFYIWLMENTQNTSLSAINEKYNYSKRLLYKLHLFFFFGSKECNFNICLLFKISKHCCYQKCQKFH